jgi:K(+)-stimulated pyrophosphate-energized sodium pump
MGGAVIYWFSGASCQGGHHRRVSRGGVHQAQHEAGGRHKASAADSQRVVGICTKYAQAGMINVFFGLFSITLAFAFLESYFFIGFLIALAFFGLFQAIFMANAGGAWDNAKKIVETELREKGTELHAQRSWATLWATVQRHVVGRDEPDHQVRHLVSGLLAVELAITLSPAWRTSLAAVFFRRSVVLRLPLVLNGMRIGFGGRKRDRPPRPKAGHQGR